MRIIFGIMTVALVLTLAGCKASDNKLTEKSQSYQLQTRVSELEGEAKAKDEEIGNLKGELDKTQETETAVSTSENPISAEAAPKAKVSDLRMTDKNIQTALKNANLYTGRIDGIIGKKTKKAIKEFQQANGLVADGIVGKKTWVVLKKYLENEKA